MQSHRVDREEEGVSSLRPELAAIARTLQATPVESNLLYLCDSEADLNKMWRWIGSGPRTTLAGDANAGIMISIIECVRARVLRGARTFMIKIKAHQCSTLEVKEARNLGCTRHPQRSRIYAKETYIRDLH